MRKFGAILIALGFLLVLSVASSPQARASEPWGACGVSTDAQKLVTTYHRDLGVPKNQGPIVPSGTTTFKCGTNGWGLKHIPIKGTTTSL